jgi:hypothetical protein
MSADLLKRLADAGTPMDLIMEVAETLAEARAAERILERRRETDRLRKRDVSAESAESLETVEIQDRVSFDKKTTPDPKKIKSFPCVREARAKGWHRLPDGWRPTRPLPDAVQAKVDQWPPGALGDELAAMRRWAANAEDKNGKGRKLDWDQAWRNWIARRHDERYSRQSSAIPGLGKTTAAIAGLGDWNDDRPM